MKKLILMLALFPLLMFAQVKVTQPAYYGDGVEWSIYCTAVDSGDYVYEFADPNLGDYDAAFATYPLNYTLKFDTLTASTGEVEILGAYIQAYIIDKWVNVDTLVATDTLNGSHTLASATFYKKSTVDMDVALFGTFPRYRLDVLANTALGTDLCAFYIKFYANRKDQ